MRTCLFLWACILRAEVIDRVAVALDNQVITESEVLREVRLTEFLNGEPVEFSQATKRKAAGRLIEQKLIRREITLGSYPEPDADGVTAIENQMRTGRFRSREEYLQALDKYGITEQDLKAHLQWQLALLRFIDARFRASIQVSDEDVRAYFESQQRGTSRPDNGATLDDLREKIRETLINQRVDKQLDTWLAETKRHTRIEVHQEAFQ